jgi:cellulose synthase/poly-beta-1,6-N-acetylglucosamine synthase-like glycosyltransferase
MLPGEARNAGCEATTGDWVVFLDADAVPEPGWLDGLLAGAGPDVDAVAGGVVNGTPGHPVGTAGWMLEFSEVLPYRRRPVRHGVTCNLLVRRSALAAGGGFPPDMWCGEDTIVTFRFAERGRLRFARDARVRHLNRTGLSDFLHHQRRLGSAFATVCEQVDFPHRWAARGPWWVLAIPLRVGALALRLAGRPTDLLLGALLSPLLLAGLAAWNVGLVTRRP